jgi:hypothetical protein
MSHDGQVKRRLVHAITGMSINNSQRCRDDFQAVSVSVLRRCVGGSILGW